MQHATRRGLLGESWSNGKVILAWDDVLPGEGPRDSTGDEMDALYDEAVAIVTESRKASISYVQRRLKIGYNRAARLIEEMERIGIVSPPETNGSRTVLAPPPVED